MANTLKIKRGLKADISKLTLVEGELAVALDTQELYVGDNEGNVKIVKGGASGAVESANKLTVARTITATGDATGSTSFDGSQNVEMALELATSGVTAGTYSKVTVDAKGRVTAGSNITVEDIGDLSTTLARLATKEELAGYVKTADLTTELNKKVDKVAGKSLIDDTEITRLASVKNYDDTAIKADIAKKADATAMSTALKGKVDKVEGKVLSSNDYTIAEKEKLAGLSNYDDTDIKASIATKANSADVYTKTEVNTKVSSVYKYKGSVTNESALPTEGQVVGDVYNLEDTGMNVAWTGEGWDNLGSVIDLTPYLTTEDAGKTYAAKATTLEGYGITDAYTKTAANTELNKKVDKEIGKQLSTNDYTTAEKTKLTGIATGAEVNKIDAVKVNGTALGITDKAVNIDLSNYATKSELDKKANSSDVYTIEEVNNSLANKLSKTDVIDGGTF
jgi:phage-related tail fiber protein